METFRVAYARVKGWFEVFKKSVTLGVAWPVGKRRLSVVRLPNKLRRTWEIVESAISIENGFTRTPCFPTRKAANSDCFPSQLCITQSNCWKVSNITRGGRVQYPRSTADSRGEKNYELPFLLICFLRAQRERKKWSSSQTFCSSRDWNRGFQEKEPGTT